MLQLASRARWGVLHKRTFFNALISSLRISQIHSKGDNCNKGVHVVCLYTYDRNEQVSVLVCSLCIYISQWRGLTGVAYPL